MFEKDALFLFPPSRGDALFPIPHDSNGSGCSATFARVAIALLICDCGEALQKTVNRRTSCKVTQ